MKTLKEMLGIREGYINYDDPELQNKIKARAYRRLAPIKCEGDE